MNSLVACGLKYSVIQINGQKIITPYESFVENANEPKEVRLYVSHIPPSMTEVELLPIFASVGPVWRFRLMMNFSGSNRGFGYVQFVHDQSYAKAFQILDGMTVEPNYRLKLKMSWNICTLIMGGVDIRFNPIFVKENLKSLLKCKDVNIMYDTMGKLTFIIIYNTHRDTAMGRRTLLQYLPAFGNGAWVRWGSK